MVLAMKTSWAWLLAGVVEPKVRGVTAVGAAHVEVVLGGYGEGVSLIIKGAAAFWLQWAYPLKS